MSTPSDRQSAAARPRAAGQGGRRAEGRPRPRRRLRRLAYVSMLCTVAVVGGGFTVLDAVRLPRATPPAETSFVCLADVPEGSCGPDTAVAQFSAEENRVTLAYADISPLMVKAVVAAEDRSFFRHNGIDPVGISRALYRDVVTGSDARQGGSTITQQYVKTAFLTRERTLTRKLKEAALAVKLERQLTKQQILERYLNEIYFGRGAYGVEAASRTYFGISARDLDLAQAAFLAGLIRAPELADPDRNPGEASRRRETVLRAMTETGVITRQQADQAAAVPWPGHFLRRRVANNTRVSVDFSSVGGDYIVEWVRQQLGDRFGEGAAYTKGLRVYLTIDASLQRLAYRSVASTLDQATDPAGSLVSVDERGRLVAMVGGRDYSRNQVNYALGTAGGGSGRQPGSTFKPFVLAAFVEQGNSIKSTYPAPPQVTMRKANQGKDWRVSNYEDEDLGNLTVEQATWKSSNTVYAQMMKQVGPAAVADLARRIGVTAPVPAVSSVVLGTAELSVLDLATAYSTLANHGALSRPFVIRRVEAPDGEVLYDGESAERSQVISPEVADTVTTALRGVMTQGTGARAAFAAESAGKTGTTQDYRDAWFAGYTCHLTTAVWMGYPEPEPMLQVHGQKVTGGTLPATIWRSFMSGASEGRPRCTYRNLDAGSKHLNPSLVPGPPTTTTTSTTTTTTTPPPPSTTLVPTTSPPAPPSTATSVPKG